MKKKKLLHITRPTEFGIYRFLADLIKYTRKDRYNIVVACPLQGPLAGYLGKHDIRVVPLDIRRNINPIADAKAFFSILAILKRERPDLVHTHCSKAGFLGRIASKSIGIPAIYTPNSWYFDEPLPEAKKKFYIALEKFAALFGEAVVTVTEEERQDIISKKITSPGKAVTIHDGIDTDFLSGSADTAELRKAYSIPPSSKVVGMIARLVPQKQPLDFVRAASRVLEEFPEARFIIVGEGPLREEVERLRGELGIGDKLILAGHCHEETEVGKFLNLIDISVLTSGYEGLPLAALQSMYLKKPMVITAVRGAREVISHQKDGMIVPVSDMERIAEAIMFLLKDEKKAKEMGEEARRSVEKSFTAGRMAKEYEELYERFSR